MANRPQPFRHHDIVKAFRAASAAGVSNPSVSVRCPGGATITIDSKPDEAPGKRAAAGGFRTSGHSLSTPAKAGRTGKR
jgi:hypothetical protein